ncbi:MAG TPA: hypothetical protein PLL33_01490 [Paracoccus sp. (in: a-proteobacteria)]|nr:hypothetical protein [Paracoccus sp. (in: a-proteobacteria)]
MKPWTLLIAALLAVSQPLAALADKPAHAGKGNGHGNGKAHAPQVMRHDGPVVVPSRRAATACPPGLAKKNPPCIPPGQAREAGWEVGDRIDWDRAHVVRRPGLYGLAEAPSGQRYAIIDGRLVRVDNDTARILAIIRGVTALLD